MFRNATNTLMRSKFLSNLANPMGWAIGGKNMDVLVEVRKALGGCVTWALLMRWSESYGGKEKIGQTTIVWCELTPAIDKGGCTDGRWQIRPKYGQTRLIWVVVWWLQSIWGCSGGGEDDCEEEGYDWWWLGIGWEEVSNKRKVVYGKWGDIKIKVTRVLSTQKSRFLTNLKHLVSLNCPVTMTQGTITILQFGSKLGTRPNVKNSICVRWIFW